MTEKFPHSELAGLTANVVAAYISKNAINAPDLPEFIRQVFATLSGLINGSYAVKPAVPINKSVTDDYIICLEDGKKLQMLKRHLRAVYKMSLEDYYQKWGLPDDYPNVAKNYAKRRSDIAKEFKLGVISYRRGKLKIVAEKNNEEQQVA